jgi:MFS family permease
LSTDEVREPATPAWPSATRGWWAVFVLIVTYAVALIDRQLLSLLVGPLKQAFTLTDTQVGLLQGVAFGIFYTLLGIPLGRLIDRSSRVFVVTLGCVLWCLMTAACGMAGSFAALFVARVGVGIGEATVSPGSLSLLSDYFPPTTRPLAVSVYVAGGSLGAGAALLGGGALIDWITAASPFGWPVVGHLAPWQSVFVLTGLTGLGAVGLLLTVREPPRRGGRATATLAEFGAFLRRRARLFTLHFGGFALFSVLCYGLLAWAPTYFIRHYHWSASRVGATLGAAIAVCGMAGVVSGGWLAMCWRRAGRTDATLRVTALGAAALTLPAALAPLAPNAAMAVALYAAAMFFVAFPSGASAAAVQDVTPNRLRAQTSSVYYFAVNLVGLGFGPPSVGLLTDHVLHDEAAVGSALALCAAVCGPASALLLCTALRPLREANRLSEA